MDLLLNDSNDDGSSNSDDDNDDDDEKMSDSLILGLGNKVRDNSNTIRTTGSICITSTTGSNNVNNSQQQLQQRPQHESSTLSSVMNVTPILTVPSSTNRTKNNTIQINNSTNHNDSVSNSSTTKGKRLLSLASVLPPHILAALTKQQQRNRNGTYDEDDDDDDDDDDEVEKNGIINNDDGVVPQHKDGRSVINRSKQYKHAKAETSNNTEPKISGKGSNNNVNKVDSKSNTISSFLKDLRQVGFTNNSTNNTKIEKINALPTNTTQIDDDQSQQLPHSETTTATPAVSKLGEAFLNSTTTTIKSNHTKSMMVRNIHEANDDDTKQSLLDNHQSSSNGSNRIDSSDIQSSSTLSTPATARNTTNDSYHLLRPKRMIQAAPQVHAAPLSHQLMSQPLQVTSSIHELPSISIEEQEQQRFLSRKEIERTLRRTGNSNINSTTGQNNTMDDVWNNMEFTQTQEGVDPNMYAPNVIATAQQQQLTSISSNASFIKHSTTHIYDPTLGTTVPYNALKSDTIDAPVSKTVAMKGKGKNQINALLAQAVALERERNEQQLQSTTIMTSKTTQQIHRANAKRKYGW